MARTLVVRRRRPEQFRHLPKEVSFSPPREKDGVLTLYYPMPGTCPMTICLYPRGTGTKVFSDGQPRVYIMGTGRVWTPDELRVVAKIHVACAKWLEDQLNGNRRS